MTALDIFAIVAICIAIITEVVLLVVDNDVNKSTTGARFSALLGWLTALVWLIIARTRQ